MIGALLGFASNIIGGRQQQRATQAANQMSQEQFASMLGQNQTQFDASLGFSEKQFQKQMQFARRQSQIGRRQFNRGLQFNKQQASLDRKMQQKFAKNATGWAFDDLMQSADESGIHRLAALGGAGGASYSPVGASAPAPSGVAGPSGSGVPGASGVGSTPIFEEEQAFLGDAVGQAISNYQASKQIQKRDTMDAKQIEMMDAQIENIKAQSRTIIDQAKSGRPNLTTAKQSLVDEATADPMASRPEDARIKKGPLKGDYVVRIAGKTYVTTGQNSPAELQEGVIGSIISEGASLQEAINLNGGQEVVRKNGVWVRKQDQKDYRRPNSPAEYKHKRRFRQTQGS